MSKKVLFFVLFTLLFLGGTYYYINAFFLPVQLKQILAAKSEEFLHRKLTIKAIDYNPMKGIVIHDVTVYRQDDPSLPFMHFDEAHFNVFLPGLIKSKQIIIPAITIDKPYVHLVRDKYDRWNFADLLVPHPATPSKKSPFTIVIGQAAVNQGRIQLTYPTSQRVVTEAFEDIQIKASFSLPTSFNYEIQLRPPEQASSLKINGRYQIASRNLTAQMDAQKIDVAKYFDLFYHNEKFDLYKGFIDQAKLKLELKNWQPSLQGDIGLDLDIAIHSGLEKEIKGQITINQLSLTRQEDSLQGKASLNAKNSSIRIADDRLITGDISSKQLAFSFADEKLELQGDAALERGDMQILGTKLQGNFLAEGVQLSFKEPELSIFGNLTVDNPQLSVKGTVVSGKQFSARTLRFSQRDEDMVLVTGATQLQDAVIQAPNSANFDGQLNSPGLFFSRKNDLMDIKGGIDARSGHLQLAKNQEISGNFFTRELKISKDNSLTTLQGLIDAKNAVFIFDEKELRDEPQINLTLRYNPDSAEKSFDYQGWIQLEEASLKGLPGFEEITNLKGRVNFTPNQLQSELLKLTALNTSLELSGWLNDFKNPIVNIKASSSDADLETVATFLSDYIAKYKIKPSGRAALRVSYSGPPQLPEQAKITLRADLKNASLNGEKLPAPITNMSGSITYDKDQVTWKNLKATFQNQEYSLDGELNGLKNPVVTTQLASKDLKLSTNFSIDQNKVTLTSLNGQYMDSGFSVKGTVALKDTTLPSVDLRSHVDLVLGNLARTNFSWTKKIKPLNLTGTLSTDLAYTGELNDPGHAVIKAAVQSPQIFIYGYKVLNLDFNYDQGSKDFGRLDGKGLFYDGGVTLTMLTDFKTEEPTFQLTAQADGTNLSKWRKDSPWREKNITGLLSITTELGGNFKDLKSIQGKGTLAISNGYLWELDLVKGFWGVLSTALIPELQQISFTDATGNCTIADKKIETKDLTLKSQPVDVLISGWVNFEQNLKLDVQPNFRETEILKSGSIMKGPTALIAGASDIFVIKVSGSLSKPSYNLSTLPGKILEKTTGAIIDGVQSIYEDFIKQ